MYKKLVIFCCLLLAFTTEVSAFLDAFTVFGTRNRNIKSYIIDNLQQATKMEWKEEGLAYPQDGYMDFYFVPIDQDRSVRLFHYCGLDEGKLKNGRSVRLFHYCELDERKLKYKGLDGMWELVKNSILVPSDFPHKIISKTENEIVFEVFFPGTAFYFSKNMIGILFKKGPYTYQEYYYGVLDTTLTQEQKDSWLTLIRNTRINF